MFIRKTRKEAKKGSIFVYQLIENKRIEGKVKQQVLCHIGSLAYTERFKNDKGERRIKPTDKELARFWHQAEENIHMFSHNHHVIYEGIESIEESKKTEFLLKNAYELQNDVTNKLAEKVSRVSKNVMVEFLLEERLRCWEKLNQISRKGGLRSAHMIGGTIADKYVWGIDDAIRSLNRLGTEVVPVMPPATEGAIDTYLACSISKAEPALKDFSLRDRDKLMQAMNKMAKS